MNPQNPLSVRYQPYLARAPLRAPEEEDKPDAGGDDDDDPRDPDAPDDGDPKPDDPPKDGE